MHKYAKEMMAMAEAAKTSDEPWRVLQFKWLDEDGDIWKECSESPRFDSTNSLRIDYRIKPKEKKKLWLWHRIENNRIVDQSYCSDEIFHTTRGVIADGWHKTNTFIEIEGEW